MARYKKLGDVTEHLHQSMQILKKERMAQDRIDADIASAAVELSGWTMDDTIALEKVLNELHKRDGEALALYQMVPGSVDFHQSLAGERGLVGPNRAGKSVASLCEVAMAAMWCHPVAGAYPQKPLEICVVGPRLEHLRLLYYGLFKEGKTFQVVCDGIEWRVPRWNNERDMELKEQWVDAPPLIPPDMVDGEPDWYTKKSEQPQMIKLKNGTVFYFFSFESDPPRGVPFDICWFDEEHPNAAKWLTEMRMRVVSRRGRLIWSATPENATVTFYGLKARAERPDMASKHIYKQTQFFELKSEDNPFLDPLGLEAAQERVREDDPDAAMAKIDGLWAFREYLVYPEYDDNKHTIPAFDLDWKDTVYLIIDPGKTRFGCLFVALLHPDNPNYLKEQPDRIIAFDEIVKKHHNAQQVAKVIARKMEKYKHWIEYIIIDFQQGRKTDEYDVSIAEHYWEELKEAGVKPRKSEFVNGNNNLSYGIEEVSKHLIPKDSLPPKFVMMSGRCPWLAHEFKKYQRQKIRLPTGVNVAGKPIPKGSELVDCTRYACCAGLQWVTPPSSGVQSSSLTLAEIRSLDNPANMSRMFYPEFYAQFDRQKRRSNR